MDRIRSLLNLDKRSGNTRRLNLLRSNSSQNIYKEDINTRSDLTETDWNRDHRRYDPSSYEDSERRNDDGRDRYRIGEDRRMHGERFEERENVRRDRYRKDNERRDRREKSPRRHRDDDDDREYGDVPEYKKKNMTDKRDMGHSRKRDEDGRPIDDQGQDSWGVSDRHYSRFRYEDREDREQRKRVRNIGRNDSDSDYNNDYIDNPDRGCGRSVKRSEKDIGENPMRNDKVYIERQNNVSRKQRQARDYEDRDRRVSRDDRYYEDSKRERRNDLGNESRREHDTGRSYDRTLDERNHDRMERYKYDRGEERRDTTGRCFYSDDDKKDESRSRECGTFSDRKLERSNQNPSWLHDSSDEDYTANGRKSPGDKRFSESRFSKDREQTGQGDDVQDENVRKQRKRESERRYHEQDLLERSSEISRRRQKKYLYLRKDSYEKSMSQKSEEQYEKRRVSYDKNDGRYRYGNSSDSGEDLEPAKDKEYEKIDKTANESRHDTRYRGSSRGSQDRGCIRKPDERQARRGIEPNEMNDERDTRTRRKSVGYRGGKARGKHNIDKVAIRKGDDDDRFRPELNVRGERRRNKSDGRSRGMGRGMHRSSKEDFTKEKDTDSSCEDREIEKDNTKDESCMDSRKIRENKKQSSHISKDENVATDVTAQDGETGTKTPVQKTKEKKEKKSDRHCETPYKVDTDNNPNDKQVQITEGPKNSDVFKFMVKQMDGKGSPEHVAMEYGFDINVDVQDWFRRHKKSFTLIEKDGEVIQVLVCCKGAECCLSYYSKQACDKDNCPRYHICKNWLCGNCKFEENCKFSHDLLDTSNNNKEISKKLGYADAFTNDEIRSILLARYPHVCEGWTTSSCENSRCPELHLCKNYVMGKCLADGASCNLDHDRFSVHNKPIVEAFRMDKYPENAIRKLLFYKRTEGADDESNMVDQYKSDRNYVTSNKADMDSNLKDGAATSALAPKDMDVFKFMVKQMDGRGSPEHVAMEYGFDLNIDVQDWFRRHKKSFTLIEKDGELIQVLVCYRSAEYCLNYYPRQACDKDNCPRYHVCKNWLCGYCKFEENCKFSHDVLDTSNNNKEISKKIGFADAFTNDEIRFILSARYPHVCEGWNTSSCENSRCPELHLCKNYVMGKCLADGASCSLDHDRFSVHNKPILEAFRMDKYPENAFRRLIFNKRTEDVIDEFQMTDGSTITDDANEFYICEWGLTGKCHRKGGCKNHHLRERKIPYLWQIKMAGKWETIDHTVDIETNYCMKEKAYCFVWEMNEAVSRVELMFDTNLHALVTRNDETKPIKAEVRRLSTMSYIDGDQTKPSFRTQWRWFLENDKKQWGSFQTNMQYTLESKFVAEQEEYLTIKDNGSRRCVVDFRKMNQTEYFHNQSTVKSILRRPLFVSDVDVDQKQFPESLGPPPIKMKVPTHWFPLDICSPFEFVRLKSESGLYKDVEASFRLTIPDCTRFVLEDIYLVQNKDLWSQYCNKEDSMMSVLKVANEDASKVNKRSLFHGTNGMTAVYGIATNNFDFRLNGQNGTAYGKGSYFAKDAAYSHRYTGNQHGHRLMFRASVLVGEYSLGKSTYNRPPERPNAHNQLYNSCVNDMENPTIFVVFDMNQYYPEFLIQYRDTREDDNEVIDKSCTIM